MSRNGIPPNRRDGEKEGGGIECRTQINDTYFILLSKGFISARDQKRNKLKRERVWAYAQERERERERGALMEGVGGSAIQKTRVQTNVSFGITHSASPNWASRHSSRRNP